MTVMRLANRTLPSPLYEAMLLQSEEIYFYLLYDEHISRRNEPAYHHGGRHESF